MDALIPDIEDAGANGPALGAEQGADFARLSEQAFTLEGATWTAPGATPGADTGAPDAPKIPTRDILAPLVGFCFATLAPAWEVSAAEQGQLVDAYAAVLDKWFPDGLDFGPEVAAVLITAGIVMPRLHSPRYAGAVIENNAGADAND